LCGRRAARGSRRGCARGGMSAMWVWLAAAVLQGVLVLIAGWAIWRRGERNVLLAVVFVSLGAVLLAANGFWLAADGPAGRSPIAMRGGMFGLWLSNLAAVELFALALLALGTPRSR